jgi:hypothetical protein
MSLRYIQILTSFYLRKRMLENFSVDLKYSSKGIRYYCISLIWKGMMLPFRLIFQQSRNC